MATRDPLQNPHSTELEKRGKNGEEMKKQRKKNLRNELKRQEWKEEDYGHKYYVLKNDREKEETTDYGYGRPPHRLP